MKTVAAHVTNELVNVADVMIWLGDRRPRGGARAAPVAAVSSSAPATPPPPLPEDLLKRADADEQINIRVYSNHNRGVVNITSASSGGGSFGSETSGSSG